jgi:hypothetical protein
MKDIGLVTVSENIFFCHEATQNVSRRTKKIKCGGRRLRWHKIQYLTVVFYFAHRFGRSLVKNTQKTTKLYSGVQSTGSPYDPARSGNSLLKYNNIESLSALQHAVLFDRIRHSGAVCSLSPPLHLPLSCPPSSCLFVSISSLGDATSRQLLTVLFVASADACMGGSWSSCSDSKPF